MTFLKPTNVNLNGDVETLEFIDDSGEDIEDPSMVKSSL